MKPFDIVKPTYKYVVSNYLIKQEDYIKAMNSVGIVVEVCNEEASVIWFGTDDLTQRQFKCAWYDNDELEVIDNLPRVFANAIDYPHFNQGNTFFPIK